MFDGLLGRKFSNKCKHSIKGIKARIVLIRRKKQATLNFLKKDVADLLAAGHEANALGRMDHLIIEMNKISCYDMIEHFCDIILGQLSYLEKQRDCPQEEIQPVATLIFAAARFSDLPELADLRHVFLGRYGNALEGSVNAQFEEKIGTRTFSKQKKLKIMQDIAQEFSVRWTINSSDQNRINSSMEIPKKTGLPISNGNLYIQQEEDIATRKQDVSNYGRSVSTSEHDVLKEIKHSQVRDIHIVSNPNNAYETSYTENRSAFHEETKRNKSFSTKPRQVMNGGKVEDLRYEAITTKEVPINQEKVQSRQTRELKPSHDMTDNAHHINSKGYNRQACSFDQNISNVSCEKSHALKGLVNHDEKDGSDSAGKSTKKLNIDEPQNTISHINRSANEDKKELNSIGRNKSEMKMNYRAPQSIIPPYNTRRQDHGNFSSDYHEDNSAFSKSNNAHHINSKGGYNRQTCTFDRSASNVSREKPYVLVSHDQKEGSDTSRKSTRKLNDGRSQNATSPIRRTPGEDNKEEFDSIGRNAGNLKVNHHHAPQNIIPPYVNSRRQYQGACTSDYHEDTSAFRKSKTQGLNSFIDGKPSAALNNHDNGKLKNMIPPYVKSTGHNDVGEKKSRSPQNLEHPSKEITSHEVKLVDTTPSFRNMAPPYVRSTSTENGYQSRCSTSDLSTTSSSDEFERKKLPKLDIVRGNRPEPRSVRRMHSKLEMVYENNASVDNGNDIVKSIDVPIERRHMQSQRSSIVDECDEEEMFMDKLLMHYSRKGTSHHSGETPRSSRTADNDFEFNEHYNQGYPDKGRTHTLGRAVTFPSKPHVDHMHPLHLPDYDELTARFNALKRG